MIEEKEELQGQLIASGNIVASMISQKGAKGDKGDKGDTGTPGTDGTDGFSPIITTEKQGKVTTLTIVDAEGTKTATILDGNDGSGTGDMLKATYDQNNNGIVDNAEKVNNHTVQSDVPSDAVFTDTTYTAGTGIEITSGNVINNTQTSAEWGNISGDIADQTDLQTALSGKQNTIDSSHKLSADLVSETSNKKFLTTSGYQYIQGNKTFQNYAIFNGETTLTETYICDHRDEGDSCIFQFDADGYNYPQWNRRVDFTGGATTTTPVNDTDVANKKYVDDNEFSGDYDDLTNKPTIPTKVSDLTNDSGFINKNVNDLTNYTTTSVINTLLAGKENDIPIQDTAPQNPEEDDLWIDTSEPEEMQEAIVNEYSESTSETYSCDYVNDLMNKQPQFCHATSTGTQTPISNYYVTLGQFDRKVGNFTFENGGVKIGSGIHTIQVSGNVFIDGWGGGNTADYVWGKIYKNNDVISTTINSTNSSYISTPIPSVVIPVSEGDIIKLMADNSNNNTSNTTIRNGGSNTYIDILVIN